MKPGAGGGGAQPEPLWKSQSAAEPSVASMPTLDMKDGKGATG